MRLRPETWETGELETHHSWWKFKICQIRTNTAATGLFLLDLEQHRSLQHDYSRCHFVRKIPDVKQHRCYETVHRSIRSEQESQHVPHLEQHPYHMRFNSFVRFDHPDLKQHSCYRTVYGSIRFIMYYYNLLRFFFFFFCVVFILEHLASPSSNTSHCLLSTEHVRRPPRGALAFYTYSCLVASKGA